MTKSHTESKPSPTFWLIQVLVVGLTAVLVIAVTLVAQKFLWNYTVADVSHDRLDALDRDAFLIESRLRGRANDIFFLKSVAEEELAHNPNGPPVSENLRSAISSMMLARSQYDKIFLLDLQGHEILRYNWKEGERPVEEALVNELKDKSDRPYFHETLSAPAGAAVFSSLDLSSESHKPVVRVGGQIVGPDGKPKALLVLNYFGDLLLRELIQDKNQPRQNMLLNSDGVWLLGPDATLDWSLVFPEKKGSNLKEENPALWNKITSRKSGWFYEEGNLYCFKNIDPTGSVADYPPLRMPLKGGEHLHWTMLVKVPEAVVWDNVRDIRTGIWAIGALVGVVLVPLVWFGLFSIQRRKIAEDHLKTSAERLSLATQVSKMGIWDWNVRTGLITWDEKMYEIYGISKGQPVNYETWKNAVVPQDLSEAEAILQRVIAEKTQDSAEFRITCPDGSLRHIQAAEGAILDRTGQVVRVVGVNLDITKRKEMELDLHEKNIELQHAAQAKNSFLANMSHELRTPLNGIIGFSELLVDGLPGDVNAEQKEYLEDILASSQHLLQLINDVLDLAKVEAGKVELHPETFSLREAIAQVCSVAHPLVQKKKIELITTFASGLDDVTLDEQKLKQVLYNLLSNAVKFTEEHGRIEIMIALHGANHFILAVRDTGIGIKPENIKRLFKEFEQLDEGTTRRYQGTGLGLALTRKIVEMQGGSIKVESEFGQGSTFTVTLPLIMVEEVVS